MFTYFAFIIIYFHSFKQHLLCHLCSVWRPRLSFTRHLEALSLSHYLSHLVPLTSLFSPPRIKLPLLSKPTPPLPTTSTSMHVFKDTAPGDNLLSVLHHLLFFSSGSSRVYKHAMTSVSKKQFFLNVLFFYSASSYQIIWVPLVAKLLEKVVHHYRFYFLSSRYFPKLPPLRLSSLSHLLLVSRPPVTSMLLNPMTLPWGSLLLDWNILFWILEFQWSSEFLSNCLSSLSLAQLVLSCSPDL